MRASVVDQIFARCEAVDPTGVHPNGAGGGAGRGVRKAPPPLRPPRRNFPVPMMETTAETKMEKAVKALGTMRVCEKRAGELAAQLTELEDWSSGPALRSSGPALRSLGDPRPRRDPDEKAIYEEERARIDAIRTEARNQLDRLFGTEVGPPLDLQAAVQQRKARSAQQQALEAQMADMAMGDAPESPAAVYASTANPRFERAEASPPAFRSLDSQG